MNGRAPRDGGPAGQRTRKGRGERNFPARGGAESHLWTDNKGKGCLQRKSRSAVDPARSRRGTARLNLHAKSGGGRLRGRGQHVYLHENDPALLETIPRHVPRNGGRSGEGQGDDGSRLACYACGENQDAALHAQGTHDLRVNKAESDQMVVALRTRGVAVEYLVTDNEGHGFHQWSFDFLATRKVQNLKPAA